VEKEAPVAKTPKRKLASKKSNKVPVETIEPETKVLEMEPDVEPTNEELFAAFDALSEIDTSEPVSEVTSEPEPQPTVEPVEVKKPKRKPRVPKNVTPPTPPASVETDNDDNEPPKWFMNYITGMKNVQNEVSDKKKSKRVLKHEADDYAKQQWKKPDLRQKVTNNVDSHMAKMYRQIFSR